MQNKQINDQHNEDKVDDYYHDEISVEVKNDESINYSDLDINCEDEDEESDFIEVISSFETNQIDLAMAFMADSLNSRITKSSLSDFTKTPNITSQFKLTVSLDG